MYATIAMRINNSLHRIPDLQSIFTEIHPHGKKTGPDYDKDARPAALKNFQQHLRTLADHFAQRVPGAY